MNIIRDILQWNRKLIKGIHKLLLGHIQFPELIQGCPQGCVWVWGVVWNKDSLCIVSIKI